MQYLSEIEPREPAVMAVAPDPAADAADGPALRLGADVAATWRILGPMPGDVGAGARVGRFGGADGRRRLRAARPRRGALPRRRPRADRPEGPARSRADAARSYCTHALTWRQRRSYAPTPGDLRGDCALAVRPAGRRLRPPRRRGSTAWPSLRTVGGITRGTRSMSRRDSCLAPPSRSRRFTRETWPPGGRRRTRPAGPPGRLRSSRIPSSA